MENAGPPREGSTPGNPEDERLRNRLAAWQGAGVIDAATAARIEAFVDANVLTQASRYGYQAEPDTSGSIMLGAAFGFVIAAVLLWRAGAALLAVVTAALAYIAAGWFDSYANYTQTLPSVGVLVTWLVPAVILAVLSETITSGHERRWAREVLRFAVVVPPTIVALFLSVNADGAAFECFAAVFALAAFGLALARSSAGYAISGGVALFIVVNEVGFRHFAQSLGFPVVLIVSGITLFAVAGGLVRLLPRLRRRG